MGLVRVMFFNTTRSHATVIGQVLHSAQNCRPNNGLLFSTIIPLPHTVLLCSSEQELLQLRRVLLNIWFVVRSRDAEREWKTFG